jgi:hypothetical protein
MSVATDMGNELKRDIRALWCWFRRPSSWSFGRGAVERREPSRRPTARLPLSPARGGEGMPRACLPAAGHDHAAQHGMLLQFPLHGEALLVKLAELLRRRMAKCVASRGPECDPLLLTVSRCPRSRLSIDRCTYVEFDADRCAYQVAIEAAPDTTVTLDTTDFDAVVNFLVQYIAERPSAAATLEVAS